MRYSIYLVALLWTLVACNKMPIGYLKTEEASFAPKVIYAYHQVEEGTPQSKGAPFSSTQIQGLAGTQPLSYAFHSVKVSAGGDEAKFLAVVKSGGLLVRGGYVQLFPEAAKSLPYGRYTISIKVSNEGHSAVLSDALTFVVKEAYEDGDAGTADED